MYNIHSLARLLYCQCHVCDISDANLCRLFTVFICLNCVGNPVIKQVWSIFHWLVLPLKPEPGFLSAYVSWSSCVQWFEVRGNCPCYWYCWNGWSSLFKLSFSYLILSFTKHVSCGNQFIYPPFKLMHTNFVP